MTSLIARDYVRIAFAIAIATCVGCSTNHSPSRVDEDGGDKGAKEGDGGVTIGNGSGGKGSTAHADGGSGGTHAGSGGTHGDGTGGTGGGGTGGDGAGGGGGQQGGGGSGGQQGGGGSGGTGGGKTSDKTCDGVDDDDDGHVDEDYAEVDTHCGKGACAATGTKACVKGVVKDSCKAGSPAASDKTCDGVDDDCNGSTDEDYEPATTHCGQGACAATGQSSCNDGQVASNCTPGSQISATDTTCDGIDDDCSGAADEDYVPATTHCGTGACAATGLSSCADGQVAQNCTPGSQISATDATCDGVDDDCSGAADEDYAPVTTHCGVGVCAATGQSSCADGQVAQNCSAGSPTLVSDTTCNGIDEDCSGAADEDYVSMTTCGSGYCRTHNTPSSCTNGNETACAPGAQLSATDATCDGVDDDCDGTNDEEYAPIATCGSGYCRAHNTPSSCSGGHVTACAPGAALSATDDTCDNVDDDCDGFVDDDFVAHCDVNSVVTCNNGTPKTTPCSDGVACTNDVCNAQTATCEFVPNDASCPNDGYDCTEEHCVIGVGCSSSPNNAYCYSTLDGDKFCNGAEKCDPAHSGQQPGPGSSGCLPGIPPCVDGWKCTDDGCDEVNDKCAITPNDASCSDGKFCTGVEKCDPTNVAQRDQDGCVKSTNPCIGVDDGKSCTKVRCDDALAQCVHDADPSFNCSDGVNCTVDACNPSAPGSNPVTGCSSTAKDCSSADNDIYACTVAYCDEVNGTCHVRNDSTLCGPNEACVTGSGCIQCQNDGDCSDHDLCTGVETCVAGQCKPGTPVNCTDAFACTDDSCSPTTGQCIHRPNDSVCFDTVCDGLDACDPSSNQRDSRGCVEDVPLNCNDGVGCTVDSCDSVLGCKNVVTDSICVAADTTKCNGTAYCDAKKGCTEPFPQGITCADDGIACTVESCVEPLGCRTISDNSLCPCGETCDPAHGGCGSFCKITTCQGKLYQCGDCIDNDNDCVTDPTNINSGIDTGSDLDCFGPCSNNEAGLAGEIPGQNNAPCKSDCYFDQDTGAGNDDCYWSHTCDPLSLPPGYPPEGDNKCAYDANINIPGSHQSCSQAQASQSADCTDYCGPLVPNGCDCFGCCYIPSLGHTVYLGSTDSSGDGSCNVEVLDDPTKCKPCTQVNGCLNTCEHCELCIGKPTLPPDCGCQLCAPGQQLCGDPCGSPCPDNYFCNTGCCTPALQ